MRKLYQILYNVGRLTDAPGGGRFLSRGDTLAVGLFPFLGDTLAWAGLRGGKALRVTKPAFPPRAPPFRARRCSALWYGVVYWQIPVCCCIGGVRLSRFFFRRTEGGLRSRPVPSGCCIAGADLLLPVAYCRCSLAPVCCRITGIDLLLPVAVLPALTCSRLLSHHWHKPAPINNREQARCAGRFPVRRNKNRLSLTLPIQQHTGLSR